MTTGTATNRTGNNVDLIRLVLALLVVFAHRGIVGAPRLGESGSLARLLASWFDGEFAVTCFFAVSGFLIFRSYENSRSLAEYGVRRVRRIYPAYLAVIVGCAALGAFLTRLPPGDYASAKLLTYLLSNLVFLNTLEPRLPGVFEGQAYAGMVNGALWTLKVEVMFYASVPAIVWLARRFGRPAVFAALYGASVVWTGWFLHLHGTTGKVLYDQISRQLPGALCYFIAGGALYYYHAAFSRHATACLAAALLGLAVDTLLPGRPLYPLCIAVVVIHIATQAPQFGNWGRFGDLSYGIYIVHFPLLQTIAHFGWLKDNPWAAFAAGLALTVATAFASWHRIEKRWLEPSSHYVRAAAKPNPGDVAGTAFPDPKGMP